MSIRKMTVRVQARCGKPGLSGCGCNGDGTGSRLVLIPRNPAAAADGSGIIRGVVVGDPRNFVSSKTGRLLYSDYDVEYDDALLAPGVEPLTDCDLQFKCCDGCEISYTDRKLSQFCSNIQLTETEGGVLVFSGCDGDSREFQLGVTEVVETTTGCTGVGESYAVSEASIAGNVLTIASKKQADSNHFEAAGGEDPLNLDIGSIGTYSRLSDGQRLDLKVPALSDCAGMTLQYRLDVGFFYDVPEDWIGFFEIMASKDGGAFGLFASVDLQAFTQRKETIYIGGTGNHIIPAGTDVDFSFYPRIRAAVDGMIGAVWRSWNMGFRSIQVTRAY